MVMEKIAQSLAEAGLEPVGPCTDLARRGPALLQRCTLLEDFTAAELETLGLAMLVVRAAPGQALIREGEVGEWMLLLLRGTVDVTKRAVSTETLAAVTGESVPTPAPAECGVPARLSVLRAGAVVGEMSMFDGEPRYATCTALEPVEAGVLTRGAISRLIREHPSVGAKLLLRLNQQLAQRLRNTSSQFLKMLQKR